MEPLTFKQCRAGEGRAGGLGSRTHSKQGPSWLCCFTVKTVKVTLDSRSTWWVPSLWSGSRLSVWSGSECEQAQVKCEQGRGSVPTRMAAPLLRTQRDSPCSQNSLAPASLCRLSLVCPARPSGQWYTTPRIAAGSRWGPDLALLGWCLPFLATIQSWPPALLPATLLRTEGPLRPPSTVSSSCVWSLGFG